MIMCKQVAKALSRERYYEMPWHRRIPMFVHIRLCVMCGKYHQQVVDFQKGFRGFLEQEGKGELDAGMHLSPEARKRMKDQLETP